MGCLFELLLEIFVEGTLSLVMWVYVSLARIFIPEKELTEKGRGRIRKIITVLSALLAATLFLGVLLSLPGESAEVNTVGRYMTLIPISVLGVQIALSIVITITRILKRKKN